MIPTIAPHIAAVVAALQGAGLVVGDADHPLVPHGWRNPSTFTAYCVVYPLQSDFDGSLEGTYEDLDTAFQVTCCGGNRDQAQDVEDVVNATLLVGVTVGGRSVLQVRPDGGAGLRKDQSVTPYVFISTPRYRLLSTPI